MDIPRTSAQSAPPLVASAADLLTTSSICPACGYPTIGMDLCAYCRPLAQDFLGPAGLSA
ncbi:hypothetical protein [Mycobacterium sp. 1274761.0]|uniref:hypothetical protein n=1 Tax=Mycobacterium sp. 1274761.0 TaxID=1834077 RepID=UPI000AC67358|nr:hypothetical protein [Mycobacterium sp. 1274761.0]